MSRHMSGKGKINEKKKTPETEKKNIRTRHGSVDPSDVGEKGNLCEFYRKSRGFDHLIFENL